MVEHEDVIRDAASAASAARVRRLIAAARRIADGRDPLGRRARQAWQRQLGLSPEAIELGIQCLETDPTPEEVAALCAGVASAARVWVVLSANVFTAAHRAIALGLAASPRVFVKASRRDPTLAALLHEAAPDLFTLVTQVAAAPGDHVSAYGRQATLKQLRAALPPGVSWHGHGPGLGVAIVGGGDDWRESAAAIAADTVAFEQRGCLSPRLVGLTRQVPLEAFCQYLAEMLRGYGERVVAPQPSHQDAAERTWFEQIGSYAGRLYPAGPGVVFAYEETPTRPDGAPDRAFIPLPPPSRSLTVFTAPEPLQALQNLRDWVTTIAIAATDETKARRWFPAARVCRYGRMQRPPFDGPVDRRPNAGGEPS